MLGGLPPLVRRLLGVVTVGAFASAAALFFPTSPLIGGVLGVLAVFRLIQLIRSWADAEEGEE